MISAVHELVEKETYTGHHHKCVAEYLEACHKLFEEGILSHKTVSSTDKQVLVNMDKGFQFFQQWKDELSARQISRCALCVIQSNILSYEFVLWIQM